LNGALRLVTLETLPKAFTSDQREQNMISTIPPAFHPPAITAEKELNISGIFFRGVKKQEVPVNQTPN
jgi:hypothetical protein